MKTTLLRNQRDRYIIRFRDSEQRQQLRIRAILNNRTLNAELLYLIGRGLEAVDSKESALTAATAKAQGANTPHTLNEGDCA